MLPPALIEATTLGDLLLRAAARWPEREALVFPHARLTYRELAERACARARALIATGVEPGDHVGVLSLNLPEMIETLFASALSGAVAVLLNARYRVDELRYVIGNADLRLLFTSTRFEAHGDFPALLRAALPGLPASGSRAPAAATPLLRAVVALERAPGSGLLCGEEFLARAADVSEQRLMVRRAQVALGAPCIMMYTSGTTSQPKGCRLSHEAVVRSALGMNRRLGITGEDIMWNPLPMFHMASILPLLSLVWSGGCFLSDVHFDAGRALAQIRATRATILYPAFPAIMADLLNHPAFDAQRLDSVRLVSNVAPPDTLRANMHVLPRALHVSAYGMTEASGISCHGAPDEDDEIRATSCGRPYDGVQMRVVDPETGRALGAGERGEMRIRGFSLFEGYYHDPERTAEAFDSDGWFRTGDLCSIGAGGQVSLSRPSQGPAEDRRRERVAARAGVLYRHASGGADGAGGRGSRCAAAGGCGGVHPVAPGHVRLGGGNRGVLSRPYRLVQDSAARALRDANGRCRPPRSRSTCCACSWNESWKRGDEAVNPRATLGGRAITAARRSGIGQYDLAEDAARLHARERAGTVAHRDALEPRRPQAPGPRRAWPPASGRSPRPDRESATHSRRNSRRAARLPSAAPGWPRWRECSRWQSPPPGGGRPTARLRNAASVAEPPTGSMIRFTPPRVAVSSRRAARSSSRAQSITWSAPQARANAAFAASPTAAITVAPRFFASWTLALPTPPAAPSTSTSSPARRPASVSSAYHAVP